MPSQPQNITETETYLVIREQAWLAMHKSGQGMSATSVQMRFVIFTYRAR